MQTFLKNINFELTFVFVYHTIKTAMTELATPPAKRVSA